MNLISEFFDKTPKPLSLATYWDVSKISDAGLLYAPKRQGFIFELEGVDGSFLSPERMTRLHLEWRSVLRLLPGEELQVIFRKRVEFAQWIEEQLAQAFLAENAYGKKILLDRLANQVRLMSHDEPRLLAQKIIACFWTDELLAEAPLTQRMQLIRSQLGSFGFAVKTLHRSQIEREIYVSAQDLSSSEAQLPEWPRLTIQADQLMINEDRFRALELAKLPETYTELGMIQAITALPYPMDIAVRLKARDIRPIISRLQKKRNLLNAKRAHRSSPQIDSQVEQIDHVLRTMADQSEGIFDMAMTIGLRLPKTLAIFQRTALANLVRESTKMDFCDFEECTLGTFDAYLECIPGFAGKNVRTHTVLGSNAIHFLPFFRPAKGDRRALVSFQTRGASLYAIDPVDSRLANYNWLVSGTSGAGKSFFVNSLLAQSSSIDPDIFIVDIGGSYNKLTHFLGGQVMSLEPDQGFSLSPFFLGKSDDPKEERMRRHHIFQVFLEMARIDGQLPALEIRHLLLEGLNQILEKDELPEHPISALIQYFDGIATSPAKRLTMLLKPWGQDSFFGQFLDNNKPVSSTERILTFDLKGLTEFEDLARVVQLIVCASLWARIRQSGAQRFSWIVLDEVAFSLLKTQPEFVDELVSTLRKYYAGAVVVVQDMEKITSNFAGSSILQNTQTKALLQQRGDPRNYSQALSLSALDQWAISSLRREKGAFSEIFLIRDEERTVLRHVPSDLEYWLSTTAPQDNHEIRKSLSSPTTNYQQNVMDFVSRKQGGRT